MLSQRPIPLMAVGLRDLDTLQKSGSQNPKGSCCGEQEPFIIFGPRGRPESGLRGRRRPLKRTGGRVGRLEVEQLAQGVVYKMSTRCVATV
jgi:hypothetical protein